jgi:hypothetical protein
VCAENGFRPELGVGEISQRIELRSPEVAIGEAVEVEVSCLPKLRTIKERGIRPFAICEANIGIETGIFEDGCAHELDQANIGRLVEYGFTKGSSVAKLREHEGRNRSPIPINLLPMKPGIVEIRIIPENRMKEIGVVVKLRAIEASIPATEPKIDPTGIDRLAVFLLVMKLSLKGRVEMKRILHAPESQWRQRLSLGEINRRP